jgi:lysyl-tRNA synthetase class 2
MMQAIAGGAAAKPFKTHHNALDLDLSLRIAPELYLKRLVVGGMDRVYEINRNFRNEGISTQHNPEFTMLEFYQAYSNYEHLMDITKKLISEVALEVNGTTILPSGELDANSKSIPRLDQFGKPIDLAPENWQELTMSDAIKKYWLANAGPAPEASTFASAETYSNFLSNASNHIYRYTEAILPTLFHRELADENSELRRLLKLQGLCDNDHADIKQGLPFGKSVANLFEFLAEPHLIQPTIIYDFPLAVSPLSKIKPDEPDWVERFEFYIGGFEIGNAFSELNDPDDQLRRFEAQLEDRKRGDEEAMAEVDTDYVRALGYGLPPTAGEGVGIDRLTMVLTGSKSIRDVILFPLLRPQSAKPDASE